MTTHKRKTSQIGSMPLFPSEADFVNPAPSKRALETALVRLKTELHHGQLDYDRLAPLKNEYSRAAQVKHSNRVKVFGEWYDIRLVKATSAFLKDWTRRRSQLEWEITQLERELASL